MYLHIRKYQLVNARWRDIIDLTDYEETIKQVVDWPPESPDNQYHLFK